MLNIKKIKDSDHYDRIIISDNEEQFHILFARNLDLYFSYFGNNNVNEYHSFIVNKDNYYFYKCVEELYANIMEEKPMKDEFNHVGRDYPLEYLRYPLVKNETIEWHSDDGFYDETSILFVTKYDDSYYITLKEGMISDMNFCTTSVRFRNSGSRYDPYNCAFMLFYNKLCNHDFENEQISMDEYIDRKFVRKR